MHMVNTRTLCHKDMRRGQNLKQKGAIKAATFMVVYNI